MASEIRANKQTNRAGLGTVTYADTGIIVSGIVTCTELSGLTALNIAGVGTASTLDINGDIDVDGHTNLDNVSIAGVTTFGNNITASGTSRFEIASIENALLDGEIAHSGDTDTLIKFPAADTISFETAGSQRLRITSSGYVHFGNTGHGTNKVGGQNVTGQDYDPYLKILANTANHWLMQARSDVTSGNGIFLRSVIHLQLILYMLLDMMKIIFT